jgi:glutaminase
LDETLDLYFQCCSIAVDAETLSIIAASLANGGTNPLTGEYKKKQKKTLSLIFLSVAFFLKELFEIVSH